MRIVVLSIVLLMFSASCKTQKKVEEVQNKEIVQNSMQKPEPQWVKELREGFPDNLFVRLERTACFGTCPIYVLSIFEDGTVIYEGKKWVDKEGIYKSSVEKEVLDKIKHQADVFKFYSMNTVYDNTNVTDLPTTITALKADEGFKVVVNRYEGPENLAILESYIDNLVKNIDWEKVEE